MVEVGSVFHSAWLNSLSYVDCHLRTLKYIFGTLSIGTGNYRASTVGIVDTDTLVPESNGSSVDTFVIENCLKN